ncbi:MAG: hypothetical protein ACE5F1_16265 [Planctomycetota bacterium]
MTTYGDRQAAAAESAAAELAARMQLIRIPWPDEARRAGYTGARVLALSARTGRLWEGYAPYGRVWGWRRLLREAEEARYDTEVYT